MTEPIDKYREGGIYEEIEYGAPAISKGIQFARHTCQSGLTKGSKVLCIGCGCGWELLEYLNHGHDAYGTEMHNIDVPALKGRVIAAAVPNLPFKDNEFDLIHCTEVLEHIRTEETESFLKECRRVAKKALFSIADSMDTWKTHINLQSPVWWVNEMRRAGYRVKNFQWFPIVNCVYKNMIIPVSYSQGYLIKCE